MNIILVAFGGAFGAILRYSVSYIFKFYLVNGVYATLLVNILGSFLIGYIISSAYVKNISQDFLKYFIILGFLGSFTTFSAFSYEAIDLFISKKFFLFVFYIFMSVIVCITATYIGILINKI